MKKFVITVLMLLLLSSCSSADNIGITKSEYTQYDELIDCSNEGKYEVFDTEGTIVAEYYCYDSEIIFKDIYFHNEIEDELIETIAYNNYSEKSISGNIFPSSRYASYTTYRGYKLSDSWYDKDEAITRTKTEIVSETDNKVEYIEYGAENKYIIDYYLDLNNDQITDTMYSVGFFYDNETIGISYVVATTVFVEGLPIIESYYYASDVFDTDVKMSDLNQYVLNEEPYNTALTFYYEDTNIVERLLYEGEVAGEIDYEITEVSGYYLSFEHREFSNVYSSDYYMDNINDHEYNMYDFTIGFGIFILILIALFVVLYIIALIPRNDGGSRMEYKASTRLLFSVMLLMSFSFIGLFILTFLFIIDLVLVGAILIMIIPLIYIIVYFAPQVEIHYDHIIVKRMFFGERRYNSGDLRKAYFSIMTGGFVLNYKSGRVDIIPFATNPNALLKYLNETLDEENYNKLYVGYKKYMKIFRMKIEEER